VIPKETVDAIFQAVVIEEVVGDFVQLKKSGSTFRGLSPFTSEKTPSFYVVPSKGIFKDFSSGKGGSAVNFLMEHEKLSYPEALKWLANKYGIEIVEREQTAEEVAAQTERESLAAVSTFAQKWFTSQLWESDQGKSVGLSYFRGRDFSDTALQDYLIGYAPEGDRSRPGLFAEAAIAAGYDRKWLLAAGLCKARDDGSLWDFFGGRVIFPIRDVTGRTVGFGGRTLRSDKKIAKYFNSPESPLYDKSRVLYGIHLARHAIVREDRCILVEGYTDVMAMRQAGIENVVSSSGTALSSSQVRLIKRFSQQVTMLFDGDPAGLRAAVRGVDIVLREGLDVKVAVLPDGEDPDTFAKARTAEQMQNWLAEHATDFIRFKTDLLSAEAGQDPMARADLARSVVASIAAVPDALKRSVLLQESATRLGLKEDVLIEEMRRVAVEQAAQSRRDAERAERAAGRPSHSGPTSAPVDSEMTGAPPPDEALDLAGGRGAAPFSGPRLAGEVGRPAREKDLLRLLLMYGKDLVEVPTDDGPVKMTLAACLFEELETLQIEIGHLTVHKVLALYRDETSDEGDWNADILTQHADMEIAKLTADLLVSPHELSHNWSERHGIFPALESDSLIEALQSSLHRLLMDEARDQGDQISKALEAAEAEGNTANTTELLRNKIEIQKHIQQLSRHFGSTILGG
jgi:DNA primase